ncbi:MAG: hypothetical protein OXI93_05425, partial [Bryobacterales bacterium]|nr:hypothetical protein [Bryobacterales bacterium]
MQVRDSYAQGRVFGFGNCLAIAGGGSGLVTRRLAAPGSLFSQRQMFEGQQRVPGDDSIRRSVDAAGAGWCDSSPGGGCHRFPIPVMLVTCMSHHPTAEARDTTARTSLRLLAVLNVLFKYACARQAARAFFLRPA